MILYVKMSLGSEVVGQVEGGQMYLITLKRHSAKTYKEMCILIKYKE